MSKVNPRSKQLAANQSLALVDTAEELVETLERLSVCLRHVEERYIDKNGEVDKSSSLFVKMKENLETAKDLMDSLKQEKWRLSRREMSVELRMGELEEYKTHMKRDMTDMNQTLEALSMRVVQLENALCEQEEKYESLEAERNEISENLATEQKKNKGLEDDLSKLQAEIKALKIQRTDSQCRQLNEDMTNKMEVLMLENSSLKDMIRNHEQVEERLQGELDEFKQISINGRGETVNKGGTDDNLKRDDKSQTDNTSSVLYRDTEVEYV